MDALLALPPMYYVAMVAKVLVAFVFVLLTVAYATYAERKVIGFMQVRLGPMRTGWYGLLQPIADGLKLFFKEEIIPKQASTFAFLVAPLIALVPAFISFAVIPFSPGIVVTNINVGLLFFLGLSSLGVYSVVLDVSAVTFDRQYWLETTINNVTSSTRTQLTGVPYSLAPWNPKDSNVYFSGGNVGIGTATPQHRLTIAGGPAWTSNGWKGAAAIDDAAAIAWQTNTAGQRFGIGHKSERKRAIPIADSTNTIQSAIPLLPARLGPVLDPRIIRLAGGRGLQTLNLLRCLLRRGLTWGER